jgi:hypothetical protein
VKEQAVKGNLQEYENGWSGQYASKEEKRSRQSIDSCAIDLSVHWSIEQRHQSFTDAKQ